MNKKEIGILVFIYNSYKDPLFQNLLLSYVKTLSKKGIYRFDLITFEQDEYRLSSTEVLSEMKILQQWNIYWHPRKFHSGQFLLLKKLYDVVNTFATVVNIKLRYKPKYIFALANVAASFGILFSKILNIKLVIYSYEPHSDFMVELGHWKKNELRYIFLNKFEKLAGKNAAHIMTGTKFMLEELNKTGSMAKIYRAPTAVDPNIFYYNSDSRTKIRKQLGIEHKNVFVYFGKFGGLYYEREIINLFEGINKTILNSFFFIATNYDHLQIKNWMTESGITKNQYSLRGFIPMDEMANYLSAGDMGIVAIPPTPSQKFRSPTKVAEYLLCGLPYITCIGVSEDDEYAVKESVGVVLKEFSVIETENSSSEFNTLLQEDKQSQRERCREVGLRYRSIEKIDKLLVEIFN